MNNEIDERFDREFGIYHPVTRTAFEMQNEDIKAFLHAEVEAARKDERRKIKEYLLENGHGGGNFRRLIIQYLEEK